MFIVLEGLDGAGKSTQVSKIQQYFTDRGVEWEYLHFPRFTTPYYGEMIARFLRGEFGGVGQVDPQLVAMLYAGDRLDAASMIRGWMEQGKVVIADRYVLSNVAYQCAKIEDEEQKKQLKEWIIGLEYDYNKIPRPDINIFLDVPFEFTTRSLTSQRSGDDRSYLNGKDDIHEASLELQLAVRDMYVKHKDSKYKVIDCATAEGGMMVADDISKLIIDEIEKVTI